LDREVGHTKITRLEVVQSMHQRKQRMADLSNAFIALPGGWGTLEEVAEILTWRQLGLINQPVILLNIQGFFTPLIQQLQTMFEEGFVRAEYLPNLKIAATPVEALSFIIPLDGLKDSL
ncbi:MAG TPA: TIGR00730 family Rossman fold protein, partial [Sphingobacteriaceae bacterium]